MSSSSLSITGVSQAVKKSSELGLKIEIENDLTLPKSSMKIGASKSRTVYVTDLSAVSAKRVRSKDREEIAVLKEQLQRVEQEKQKAVEQWRMTSHKLDTSTKNLTRMASKLEQREREQLELLDVMGRASDLISANTRLMVTQQLLTSMRSFSLPLDLYAQLSTMNPSRLNAGHNSACRDEEKARLKRKHI